MRTKELQMIVQNRIISGDWGENQTSQDIRSRLKCLVESASAHPSVRIQESADHDPFAVDVPATAY